MREDLDRNTCRAVFPALLKSYKNLIKTTHKTFVKYK